MKSARLSNSIVVEIIDCDNLADHYHPDFVRDCVPCTKDTALGMVYDGANFSEPAHEILLGDLKLEQYQAIDVFIAEKIKSNGFDYDNLGELAAYMQSEISKYKIEALTIWQWVEKCQLVQSDIKIEAVKYDSVDDALAALPSFELVEY